MRSDSSADQQHRLEKKLDDDRGLQFKLEMEAIRDLQARDCSTVERGKGWDLMCFGCLWINMIHRGCWHDIDPGKKKKGSRRRSTSFSGGQVPSKKVISNSVCCSSGASLRTG